jgi:hypothetical protein
MLENETVSWVAYRVTPFEFNAVTINVGRWTDTEIEVTGFAGAYGKEHWTLNGGDKVKITVWNPQTGADPATYEATIIGTAADVLPHITSVSPISQNADETILIKGQGFGSHSPYSNQTTPYLAIADETANWVAGRVGPQNIYSILLSVDHWTDTEIGVTGFGGAYGQRDERLNLGDQLIIKVWNAQNGAGPATYRLAVGR